MVKNCSGVLALTGMLTLNPVEVNVPVESTVQVDMGAVTFVLPSTL